MTDARGTAPQFIVQTESGQPIPMGALPTYHARRDPRRPMISQGDITITREEFDARANRRARMLAQRGVGQGDFVTVALPNSFEFYETSFALWKLGATPNPVSAKLPDGELRAIVDLVRPALVVGVSPERLPGHSVIEGGAPLDESLSADPLLDRISPYWKALTSGGSTGRPKVIVDHNPGAWDPAAATLRQAVDDVLLNPGGPLYHNAPFSLLHAGLFVGGHVVEMGKFEPLEALRLIERHKVNWVNLVPTMMHRIWRLSDAERAAFDLSSLRIVYHMASACPVWLKRNWIEWLGPDRIWELYGGTERQGATEIGGRDWLSHPGSVGTPHYGCKVRILNEAGEECAAGEVGDIYFLPADGQRNSTYHYIGADAQAVGDWETIGDMGYLSEDGFLYLVDRRTDLIISGGANIYPAEVESALDHHPDVRSSIVIGLPDDDLGQRVHALVEMKPGAARDEEALREHLAEQLVRYKIPRTFEFVDTPLRDDAGKARRSALREERINSAQR